MWLCKGTLNQHWINPAPFSLYTHVFTDTAFWKLGEFGTENNPAELNGQMRLIFRDVTSSRNGLKRYTLKRYTSKRYTLTVRHRESNATQKVGLTTKLRALVGDHECHVVYLEQCLVTIAFFQQFDKLNPTMKLREVNWGHLLAKCSFAVCHYRDIGRVYSGAITHRVNLIYRATNVSHSTQALANQISFV